MGENVAVEQQICEICGHNVETGAILLDRRLRGKFENMHVTTGIGRCAGCKTLVAEDRVALVTILDQGQGDMITNENAVRTGSLIWMKRHIFNDIFSVDQDTDKFDFMFIDKEIENKIRDMLPKPEAESKDEKP